MEKEISLKEWCSRYINGDFMAEDRATQISAGWYDWFCEDDTLERRLRAMAPLVLAIKSSPRFNQNKVFVFFKNCCPAIKHPLYDQFKICDMKTGDVMFCVSFNAFGSGNTAVDGPANKFKEPLFAGSNAQVEEWFNSKRKR